uniref:Uncharacterized protein n=1 Tax=Echinococcus granulosus TaxID=6210 RepID=A0A068WBT3_ECHGR|nr:hypothetical protein EgrG_002012600 [Echinococcus granulosus]
MVVRKVRRGVVVSEKPMLRHRSPNIEVACCYTVQSKVRAFALELLVFGKMLGGGSVAEVSVQMRGVLRADIALDEIEESNQL